VADDATVEFRERLVDAVREFQGFTKVVMINRLESRAALNRALTISTR
jgi:hypothetical protein